jgi:hypothetical protein
MATALKWGCSVTKTEAITLMVNHIESIHISEIEDSAGEISHRLNFRMTSGKTVYVPFTGENSLYLARGAHHEARTLIQEDNPYLNLPDNAIGV